MEISTIPARGAPPGREYFPSQMLNSTAWCSTERRSIRSAPPSPRPPITMTSTRIILTRKSLRLSVARSTKAYSTRSRSKNSCLQVRATIRDRPRLKSQQTCNRTRHFLAHAVYRHFLSRSPLTMPTRTGRLLPQNSSQKT